MTNLDKKEQIGALYFQKVKEIIYELEEKYGVEIVPLEVYLIEIDGESIYDECEEL